MAQQTISDEELQLKKRARRRLVGAVALVLLAVIFLPMVLDKEPKPVGQDIAIHIPSQEDTGFKPKLPAAVVAPVQDAAQAQKPVESAAPASDPAKGQPPSPLPEAKPAEAEPKNVKPQTVAVAVEKPAAAEKPVKPAATEQKAVHAPKSQGFVILLGAFANMDNAKQRQAKLIESGVRFYTEKVKTPNGEKLRVRAGPYVTRDEAEKVLARLKAQGIQDGIVTGKN